MMRINSESLEQIKVCEWLRQCTDLPFFHIPNERKSSPQQGAILKRMGVVSGVSDLMIPRATKSTHGTFIELKSSTGRPSPAQTKFLAAMHRENYSVHVAYGAEEAINIIRTLYEIPSS